MVLHINWTAVQSSIKPQLTHSQIVSTEYGFTPPTNIHQYHSRDTRKELHTHHTHVEIEPSLRRDEQRFHHWATDWWHEYVVLVDCGSASQPASVVGTVCVGTLMLWVWQQYWYTSSVSSVSCTPGLGQDQHKCGLYWSFWLAMPATMRLEGSSTESEIEFSTG